MLFVDIEGKKNGREEAVKQTRAGICQAHSLLHSLTLNADQFQLQSQNTSRGLKKRGCKKRNRAQLNVSGELGIIHATLGMQSFNILLDLTLHLQR